MTERPLRAPTMPYLPRPGVSPVTATLIALDAIRPKDHVLDVGCGTGTEAILLATWGLKRIDGIDNDAKSIGIARGRATRRKLNKRVRFHVLDARDLATTFKPKAFDVVLHTLVSNNLEEDDVEPHFRAIRDVIKPDGLLVVQERVHVDFENGAPDTLAPLQGLEKHFELTPGISTHLPEAHARVRDPDFARIVLWLGRPRA